MICFLNYLNFLSFFSILPSIIVVFYPISLKNSLFLNWSLEDLIFGWKPKATDRDKHWEIAQALPMGPALKPETILSKSPVFNMENGKGETGGVYGGEPTTASPSGGNSQISSLKRKRDSDFEVVDHTQANLDDIPNVTRLGNIVDLLKKSKPIELRLIIKDKEDRVLLKNILKENPGSLAAYQWSNNNRLSNSFSLRSMLENKYKEVFDNISSAKKADPANHSLTFKSDKILSYDQMKLEKEQLNIVLDSLNKPENSGVRITKAIKDPRNQDLIRPLVKEHSEHLNSAKSLSRTTNSKYARHTIEDRLAALYHNIKISPEFTNQNTNQSSSNSKKK